MQGVVTFGMLLIVMTDALSTTTTRTRRYRFPLMRTKRGLRDIRGVPTENLKGRPGQGYYIAVEVGSPPQRVSHPEDTSPDSRDQNLYDVVIQAVLYKENVSY